MGASPTRAGVPVRGAMALLLAALTLLAALPSALPAAAQDARDAALRRHVEVLASELVCQTCGGATVAVSDRPEAETVRLFLARHLAAGDDGRTAIAAALATWPEDLTHRAPDAMPAWARWIGPPILVVCLLLLIVVAWRRMQWGGDVGGAVSFDRAERERLDRLVDRLVRAHEERSKPDRDGGA
ncbi:MAG: cytochrome c-type biogenesis protein CcmH [Alphaproteobacteria bacterium]